MSSTFAKVEAIAQQEYTFGCMRTFMETRNLFVVPPPFSLPFLALPCTPCWRRTPNDEGLATKDVVHRSSQLRALEAFVASRRREDEKEVSARVDSLHATLGDLRRCQQEDREHMEQIHDDIRVLCGSPRRGHGRAAPAPTAAPAADVPPADEPPAGVRRARAAAATNAGRAGAAPAAAAPPPKSPPAAPAEPAPAEPAPVAPSPAVTRGAGRARGARPVGNGARPPLPVTQLDAPSAFAAPSAFSERAPARSAAPPPSASSARRHPSPSPRVTQTIVTQHPPPAASFRRASPRSRRPARATAAARSGGPLNSPPRAAPPLRGGGAPTCRRRSRRIAAPRPRPARWRLDTTRRNLSRLLYPLSATLLPLSPTLPLRRLHARRRGARRPVAVLAAAAEAAAPHILVGARARRRVGPPAVVAAQRRRVLPPRRLLAVARAAAAAAARAARWAYTCPQCTCIAIEAPTRKSESTPAAMRPAASVASPSSDDPHSSGPRVPSYASGIHEQSSEVSSGATAAATPVAMPDTSSGAASASTHASSGGCAPRGDRTLAFAAVAAAHAAPRRAATYAPASVFGS